MGKKKPNYDSILADLYAELGNAKGEVALLREENARQAKVIEELNGSRNATLIELTRFTTGVRYTLDRLATFNRGLATRPITDGDRMALMLVDGIVAPLKMAAFKTGEFLPQKKEE